MRHPPAYFDAIRSHAARRWDQLEQDPELAGPWHQLFKQVQSPRHVLSELLQNADDAGANEASVAIDNDVLTFEHNGEDFSEHHFASLCRFGYSNKRALHTIGFRGIGFKSTFSLGDRVEVHTPTLAVAFARERFTEPHWLAEDLGTSNRTSVRVAIASEHRRRELEKNLEEWIKSPVSLLFFRGIRQLRIGERTVRWAVRGPGPVPESEWVTLVERPDERLLVLRSEAESFPAEALTEIRQERLLGLDDEAVFPPCKVELVLGAAGRLFVVLPTGVQTRLPFACNAPFIQDPARLKIKDPETSPTNTWLLERAGQLAAQAMLAWLGVSESLPADRAPAYDLLPDIDVNDASLEATCGAIVEEAFAQTVEDSPILLTDNGSLTTRQGSIAVPNELFDVWPPAQLASLLDDLGRPALSQHVTPHACTKLRRRGWVDAIDKGRVLKCLQTKHFPRPPTWRQLLILWTYLAPDVLGVRQGVKPEALRIVPAQGKDVLCAASEVVRLGERKLLHSDEDWEFLAAHLTVLNPNWPRFLAEQRRDAEGAADHARLNLIEATYAVLDKIGLDDTSDASKVIDQVAAGFFRQARIDVRDCVRIAQIAAKLGATAGAAFRFVTRDCSDQSVESRVFFDPDGSLEHLLPEQQRDAQVLHPQYQSDYASCSRDEWHAWVGSGRAGLMTFVPLLKRSREISGRRNAEQEARRRGFDGSLYYRYVTNRFLIEDWDFDESCWRHWKQLEGTDSRVWVRIVERVLGQSPGFWNRATTARIVQVATSGSTRSIASDSLLPSWILRLRELPCLPDMRGFAHVPADLLRRTAETESLIDVEPFVNARLDSEATRPLLDCLGVRRTPTGPDRLLDCLRALSKAAAPPAQEVDKWYRRLDQMVDSCSTADLQKIQQALRDEPLILSQNGGWVVVGGIFQTSDEEDVPGAAVVRPSVADLALWGKIGVSPRPTADLAIQWLMTLPTDEALSPEDLRRIRALLARYPTRIWEQCKHWLNLAGEWVATESLDYALTMQSLTPWRHLHEWVRQATADLQRLHTELTSALPFSALPTLASKVEEKLSQRISLEGVSQPKEWLTIIGRELTRARFESDDETARIRGLASNLARSMWCESPGLEVVPYIDGVPAGTPRAADVLWLGDRILVDRLPKPRLARQIPDEIGKVFGRTDIKAALDYGFERSPEDVSEYMRENFDLLDALVAPPLDVAPLAARATAEVAAASLRTSAECESEKQCGDSDDSVQGDVAASHGAPASAVPEKPSDGAEPSDLSAPEPCRARHTSRVTKPAIIERFAVALGFQFDGGDRFIHEDGSWIARASGDRFPWERRNAQGELVRYYLPKDHCIEREPLQLDADAWALVERFPDRYALVLADPENTAVEVTGARLRAMREAGEIALYPATYRLVCSSEHPHHEISR
jgi:hypothetical protein